MERVAFLASVMGLWSLTFGGGGAVARAGEAVRFDFESGDLQGWRVVEGKFDKFLCDREKFHNGGAPYNKQGKFFLSSLERREGLPDDSFIGVAESPVFVLTGPEMRLLVGGGSHPKVYVALCNADGKELEQARGRDTEKMSLITWKRPDLVGKAVFVRLVDGSAGGWGHITMDGFEAAGRLDPKATQKHFETRKPMLGDLPAGAPSPKPRPAARKARPAKSLPAPGSPETLRAAIADLADTFGPRYPKADELLRKLDDIEKRMKAQASDTPAGKATQEEFLALHRQALLANPLIADQPILFVSRGQYRGDHHNTATMFQTGEINTGSFRGGSAVKTFDAGTGKVRTLLDVPEGIARDVDVSFDGQRVLLSMRNDKADDYHLYELAVTADGAPAGRPRQLTSGSGVSDIDPLYMPDGRIAFSSTREPKYCMCNRHIMANLFRMNADGTNIEQIGKSTLHEGHGSLTPDGRILYDRWEYVDRNFGDAQGVWICNPDGTNHAVFYGNNTNSPGAMLDNRVVPGSGGSVFISTYSSCHDRPWGAIALVDRTRGLDSPAGELRTWPASAMTLLGKGNYDTFTRVFPKYEDPYPLAGGADSLGAGRYFLCSRQTGAGDQMGVYLIDVFGNEILLHAEENTSLGCYDPMPLCSRIKPAAMPDRRDLTDPEGRFYIYDVYIGTGMEKVRRGRVKSVRVVESPEKRFWTQTAWSGSGTQAPGMAWDDFNNKRILGTAPVEPDGSAYFSVPADKFVYFQLLDANGMMVQSMRSGTIVRPGENIGCVGCHEDRQSAAGHHEMAAMQRAPSKLKPFYGSPRLYNYLAEVQPVFDRNCLKCHDYGKPGAKKVTLCGDLGLIFNASYFDLRSKKLVTVPGAGPYRTLHPYSWGSHASKIMQVLQKGHNNVKLSDEDFARLVTWIDINAPYYPSYASAHPANQYGRSPLSNQQLSELSKLVGLPLNRQNHVTAVSFTRPEMSPCLAKLDKSDPKYARALEIIRAGKETLAQRPRAEMPGFKLIGIEAQRQAKYDALAAEMEKMRQAIAAGRKLAPANGAGKN